MSCSQFTISQKLLAYGCMAGDSGSGETPAPTSGTGATDKTDSQTTAGTSKTWIKEKHKKKDKLIRLQYAA